MNSVLLDQARNSLTQKDALFQKASLQFLQGSVPDHEEMNLLLRSFLAEEIFSLEGYVLFLKKALSFIFLNGKDASFLSRDSCHEIVLKICKNGFFQDFPFIQALQDLILFFLQKKREFTPPKILSKGALLIEPFFNEKEQHLPDLERGATLSLLWFLFGRISGKEEWVQASFRMASWYLKILDRNFFPFVALWKEERNFREKDLLTSLFLMFDAFGSFFQVEQMKKAKERLLEKIHALPEEVSLPFFYLLLGHEIDRWKKSASPLISEKERKEKVWFDPDLLLVCYSGNHLESALSLLGNRSTLGAIHAGDVQIRSFGPQWFPIGDCSGFGIVRFASSKSLLGDLEWKKNENGYSLWGCAALSSSKEEDFSCWMEVKNSVEKEKFSLELDFHGDFKQRLGFVFYVCAKNAHIDGKMELTSSTLQRYEGPARKVSFKGKMGSIEVRSQNLSCMHLIPLGGNQAFWRSDFLLAYEISPQIGRSSFLIERI